MSFWNFSKEYLNNTCICNNVTYEEVNFVVGEMQKKLSAYKKQVVCILVKNTFDCLAVYLAALRNNDAVILLNPLLDKQLLNSLIEAYEPDWIFGEFESCDYEEIESQFWKHKNHSGYEVNEDLALLLSTSGTTGNPKLVRLSYDAISSNAKSIANYLSLNSSERAITSLPMYYSYGLSVINSHLLVGGSLALTNDSVISREFWDIVKSSQCTSMAGVPYTYQMLHKLGLKRINPHNIQTLTQAGGKLSEELTKEINDWAIEKGKRFFVMYGQTEATARISYVPSDKLKDKIGSIGIAIPGGQLSLDTNDEIIYVGPNVMYGYAQGKDDLKLGDDNKGVLKTGDLGFVDSDNYYYISGRIKRFIKLFGNRINLDDIENYISKETNCICIASGNDDELMITVESNDNNLIVQIQEILSTKFNMRLGIRIRLVGNVPRLSNGKIDYKAASD